MLQISTAEKSNLIFDEPQLQAASHPLARKAEESGPDSADSVPQAAAIEDRVSRDPEFSLNGYTSKHMR